MNRGVVVGEVWGTRKCRSLVGKKLVLVDLWQRGESTGEIVVATDTLDASEGDRVLVTYGSGARNLFAPAPDNRHVFTDAAIAQIIDGEG